MSADLHLHSTVSDGVLPPAELVRQAVASGIVVMALTDHDSTDGLLEARGEITRYPGHTLVPGIELSTDVPQGEVHILGYFLDVDDPALQATLASFRDDRVGRARRMVEKLAAIGMLLDWERVLAIAGDGAIGRPHIAEALVERGYVSSIREAFDRYLGNEGPAYASRRKMTPAEAVELIRRYGGIACLAHPRETPDVEALLPDLHRAGLEGMEVYYGLYSPTERARYRSLCEAYGLLALGGSDYHGPGRAAECPLGSSDTPTEVGDRLLALHAARTGR